VATLREEIQQLRTEFEFYRLSHPEPPVCWPQRPSDSTVESLAAVHSERTEKERRRQNVVVTGMKELEGEDDVDAFCELCETCLPVKPSVIRERCRRLGRRVSGKTRPLLVTLANERSAAELLQCARLLRNSQNATGIYINADRTKAEALAAFQERERRRAKRAAAQVLLWQVQMFRKKMLGTQTRTYKLRTPLVLPQRDVRQIYWLSHE